MKKLLIIALVLSLATVTAVLTGFQIRSIRPQPVALLDSATVFDLQKVRRLKPTDAQLVQAFQLCERGEMDTATDDRLRDYMLSLRSFPLSQAYEGYSYALRENDRWNTAAERMKDMADSVQGYIYARHYFTAAKYALALKDTNAMVKLLYAYMQNDSIGYKTVDRDETFRALDNYPAYYYMMDDFVQQDSALGYQSTFRTLRLAPATALPLSVDLATINKTYEYLEDTATGIYKSPYTLRDDAMRDLVRGNRWGRFGRETDHSVQHVASLHLSDKFYTYVYSEQTWRGKMMMEEVVAVPALDSASAEEKEVAIPAKESPEIYDGSNRIFIVNVDKYGRKIAEQQIACKCSPIHISTAVVDRNGLIEVKEQDQKWKDDPLTAGYEKNEVIRRDVTAVTHYKVKANGDIVQVADGVTAKAQ